MADFTLVNLNMLYLRFRAFVEKECHTPLGCMYLISALEKNGISVDFRDYQLYNGDEPFDKDNFLSFLEGSADIIGFSCMANLLPFTVLMMKAVKEKWPQKTLILGGVGPKAVEMKLMERFPWIDIIGKGEGENYVPELIEKVLKKQSLRDVPAVLYRHDGSIHENKRPQRIRELDSIELPAFGRVDLTKYQGYNVLTSRGCPYKCTFCSVAPVWDHTAYFRNNESIIKEMEILHETTGQELFLFQDEFFLSGKQRAMDFCETLKKRGSRLKWKAFGRINLVDTELMRAMSDAGCIELRFGVESGSEQILKMVKKEFTPQQVIEVISESARIFQRTDAFYIWGFPFETMQDFYASLFQMVSFRGMGVRILPSLLTYLPQTQMYDDYKGSGKFEFFPGLIPEYMLTGHELCRYPEVTIEGKYSYIFELIRQHPDIFTGFYLIDVQSNIMPKLDILKKYGFYPDMEQSAESCGAHSAKLPAGTITSPGSPNRCV